MAHGKLCMEFRFQSLQLKFLWNTVMLIFCLVYGRFAL